MPFIPYSPKNTPLTHVRLYVLPLNECTYCVLYILEFKMVLNIVEHFILAIFVVYREWVTLLIVCAWHLSYELCRTKSDILLLLFPLTNCESLWIKLDRK